MSRPTPEQFRNLAEKMFEEDTGNTGYLLASFSADLAVRLAKMGRVGGMTPTDFAVARSLLASMEEVLVHVHDDLRQEEERLKARGE